MPVEKLTKKRLIQIVIMLCILIAAFSYKTCSYKNMDSSNQIQEQKSR